MTNPAVTHPFVSAKADSADATLASANEWNAAHSFLVDHDTLVGRTTAGRGAAEVVPVKAPLTIAADGLGLGAGIAPVALTYSSGGTTAWDTAAAQNATLACAGGNTTMGAPSNVVVGAYYALRIVQDTTPRGIAWNAAYHWAGGASGVPTISPGSGAVDIFVFRGAASNVLEDAGYRQDVK